MGVYIDRAHAGVPGRPTEPSPDSAMACAGARAGAGKEGVQLARRRGLAVGEGVSKLDCRHSDHDPRNSTISL